MNVIGSWCVVAIAMVVLAGCGQTSPAAPHGGTSTWSVSDVQAAMQKAGLSGFKQIPTSEIAEGKQLKGLSSDDVLGGFYYVSPNLGTPFGYTVAIVRDPATLPKLKAGLRAEGGPVGPVRFLGHGNVLISVLSSHPTAADKAMAARLPLIFHHLASSG